MKRILFLLLALLSFSPAARAQQGDTLEWLPVGTEWVYEMVMPNPPMDYAYSIKCNVVKDTLYKGRRSKSIRMNYPSDPIESVSWVYLSRTGPQNDSIWIADDILHTSEGIGQWRFYFRTSAQVGDTIYYSISDNYPADYFKARVQSVNDTLISSYKLPYLQLESLDQNYDKGLSGLRACGFIIGEQQNKYNFLRRLYPDLISLGGLYLDRPIPAQISVFYFGCGLRCFTHPQLGTLRFDSPEMQAQHPDNCYYGSLVSRKDCAPAALDLSLHPNPATGRVAVEFAGWGHLEAYDAQGRQVLRREGSGPLDLDVSGWVPGLYTLRLRTGKTECTARLVKN